MRRKLITLTLGILAAFVLAIPASAGPGKGPKKTAVAACPAAVSLTQAYHQQHRTLIKTYHAARKAARTAFVAQYATPTDEQLKTYREARHAALKASLKERKAAADKFRADLKAALQACAASA